MLNAPVRPFEIYAPTITELLVAEWRRKRGRDSWAVARAFVRGVPYHQACLRTRGAVDWRLVALSVRRTQGGTAVDVWRQLKAWRAETEALTPMGHVGKLLGMSFVVDEGWPGG